MRAGTRLDESLLRRGGKIYEVFEGNKVILRARKGMDLGGVSFYPAHTTNGMLSGSMQPTIPTQSYEALCALEKSAPVSALAALEELPTLFEAKANSWNHTTVNHAPETELQEILNDKLAFFTIEIRVKAEVALLAKLTLRTPELVGRESLPDSILEFYPEAFNRIAADLVGLDEMSTQLDGSLLAKYVRFLYALTIPCGAEDFDLKDCIPVSSCILAIKRERSLKSLVRYSKKRGTGVWFRSHTNTETLEEFSESGFDRYYLRIAELLERRPDVRGLVSTSWFHDPQLLEISPRLAFLQLGPVEGGAYLMRHSSSKNDIDFATRKSQTRARLYQEGKYVPIMYSLIWGREELIAWSKSI